MNAYIVLKLGNKMDYLNSDLNLGDKNGATELSTWVIKMDLGIFELG
jgi:hypothetical protein